MNRPSQHAKKNRPVIVFLHRVSPIHFLKTNYIQLFFKNTSVVFFFDNVCFTSISKKVGDTVNTHRNIKRTGWTNTCLYTVSAAPSYVGQVPMHRGARTNGFRIGEGGTRRLSS